MSSTRLRITTKTRTAGVVAVVYVFLMMSFTTTIKTRTTVVVVAVTVVFVVIVVAKYVHQLKIVYSLKIYEYILYFQGLVNVPRRRGKLRNILYVNIKFNVI